MCKILGRIRIWIWIGIKMECRIRIGITTIRIGIQTIRIRIGIKTILDPDRHQNDADPQHWEDCGPIDMKKLILTV